MIIAISVWISQQRQLAWLGLVSYGDSVVKRQFLKDKGVELGYSLRYERVQFLNSEI